jgi:YD repeat-containing protein
VYATAGNHPGSTGGYKAQLTYYDVMGRPVKQSNPTEISGSWAPAGDDAAGWIFPNPTAYDWKARPLTVYNTDTTYKTASYTGCGCAGGEVVTLTDEVNRQQKIYSDVLGRQWKTEIMSWPDGNGNRSVYSTTVSVYNARDQVTNVKQYAGVASADASSTNAAASCPSGTCQETIATYDPYGRLQTKHVPEQNAGTATAYAYNPDDTIYSVTDARGASATYTYNGRHLVTAINYWAPAGITPTANVTLGYDAAGNRISMTDGFGSKSYSYSQLSQLMSETRQFADPSPPYLNGSYTLSYDYNFAGELKKITDPTNMTINYSYDSAGRLNTVTGSDNLYAGVSQYASGLQYRAWGAVKHLGYGNLLTLDLSYNNRLQATEYDLKTSGGSFVMGDQYQYYSDGRLSGSTDLTNSNLNRGYGYDQVGRLGGGTTANGSLNGPYSQSYSYDVWGNMTYRSWRTFAYNQFCHCIAPQTNSSSSTYSNNRNTASGWNYDADGRLLASSDSGVNLNYTFDAVGQLISSTGPGRTIGQGVDGDGLRARWVENSVTTYYVRSTLLGGQTIIELDQYGNKTRGYVYGGGQEIAKQEGGQVLWDQRDVSGVSMRLTNSSGIVTSKVETDPLGTQVSDSSAYNYNGGGNGYGFNPNGFYGDPTNANTGCSLSGLQMSCSQAQHLVEVGMYDRRKLVVGNPWSLNNMFAQMGNPLLAINGHTEYYVREQSQHGTLTYFADKGLNALAQQSYALADHYLGGFGLFWHEFGHGGSEGGGFGGEFLPQGSGSHGTFDDAYQNCLGSLAGQPEPGLAQAADIILIANRTSVDPTLLAVTWLNEGWKDSDGHFNFAPNVALHSPGNPIGDIGPGGLYPGTWDKAPYTDGLQNPFGSNRQVGQPFNGNSFENLFVAARALNSFFGPVRGNERSKVAGLYRAGSESGYGYKDRVARFKKQSPGYDAFFNCLAKQGFSP